MVTLFFLYQTVSEIFGCICPMSQSTKDLPTNNATFGPQRQVRQSVRRLDNETFVVLGTTDSLIQLDSLGLELIWRADCAVPCLQFCLRPETSPTADSTPPIVS